MTPTTTHSAVVSFPAPTQILVTRDFAAPRHLVYRAHVEPDLVARWWAGDRGVVDRIDIDLRVGGRWRYVMTAHEGFQVAFHGEYRVVVPDETIVYTEVFEGAPGPDPDADPVVCTSTFTDRGAGTRLTVLTEVSSVELRDAIVASGMEVGLQEGLDRLEQVALSLA
ncbi:SRPBCC family protein [Nakamurella sp.]|uniref:SRPBCC family protein n=1 Tax=Nakamurella sp. TaxID=1869182 RepID=UPI003B3B5FF5